MNPILARRIAVLLPVLACALGARAASIDERVDALLAKMTLEEKVGQLNQLSAPWSPTGPMPVQGDLRQAIATGQVGSMFNVVGADATRRLQEVAMQSRLRIPLLFGQDVIHGYLTTFPIPLGEAASFDLEAIERSARIAATEAAAGGIHWTFAPMVDIARDPRWGRVMEGAGEDPVLGARIAAARVRGFQGPGLGDLSAVMATAKHFAAYGAGVGGRDYNSVDMSLRTLREIYLPPFQAAAQAGAASFMNSFNDINGIPATGNRMLLTDILKGEWGFRGVVVSDWGSIGEMVAHGYARDLSDAAREAITAGNDMDMQSEAYRKHLAELVSGGKVPLARVDDAVRRVLRKKFELGLFEDPYRFSDAAREKTVLADPAHRRAAREVAGRSIVLLRNEGGVLPLARGLRTIAFVGPLAREHQENHGGWSVTLPGVDYSKFVESQWDALRSRVGAGTRVLYAKGCDLEGVRRDGFAEAVEAAREADVVIASVGESWTMSGEAKSRSDIGLPGVQEELLRALHATGKPLVVLVNAGRPLVFDWTTDHAAAILYTWWLGTEAGNAIADVLMGEVNPAARLPLSFPRSVGQVPVYYNHLNTGRPSPTDLAGEYKSGYIDLPNSPRYPFGYGLSYTTFAYSDLALDRRALRGAGKVGVRLRVKNTGARDGDEVVQLYTRQRVASVVRPVKELKDFRRIHLAAGESREIAFEIDRDALAFYNDRLQRVTEPGEIDVMVGASSEDIRLRDSFALAE